MHLDVSDWGDGRVNLVTPHGVPIDVITRSPHGTTRKVPDLLLNTKDKPRPDLALVLVCHVESYCEPVILGWTWEHEVRQRNEIVKHSANTSYSYPPHLLRPIQDLYTISPWTPPGYQAPLL